MITDLTRRYALTGGAALIAAPLLTWPRLALAAGVALAPDYTANWRVHKLSSKVKVEQISGGIRASTSTLLDDIKYQVALWSKERVSGDWTIKFGYKVISRLSASGGTFCCFYFNGVGEGSTRYPTNISSWTNIEPEDTVYFQHSRGLRFSFATANPNPKFPERLRLRRYNRFDRPLHRRAVAQGVPVHDRGALPRGRHQEGDQADGRRHQQKHERHQELQLDRCHVDPEVAGRAYRLPLARSGRRGHRPHGHAGLILMVRA